MINQVWIKQINGGGKIKTELLNMFSKGLSVCLLYKKVSSEDDNDLRDFLEIPILRGLILRIPQSKMKVLGNVQIENK